MIAILLFETVACQQTVAQLQTKNRALEVWSPFVETFASIR